MLSDRVRSRVNGLVATKPLLNELVWRMYYSPDKRQPSVPLSTPEWETYGNTLIENGIVAIPGFVAEAEAMQRVYFDLIESDREDDSKRLLVSSDLGERGKKTGNRNFFISFRDPDLSSFVLNSDLAGIVYNYYGRQPYFRNQPLLAVQHFGVEMEKDTTNKYHLDGFRQISYMLLVNDLTIDDIHMQYALGSNRERHSLTEAKDRFTFSDESVEQKYEIFDCIGPKGTLFVFDAGGGFHRGLPKRGSTRKILHFNITTGHFLTVGTRYDRASEWPQLRTAPRHVQRMFDKVLAP